MDDALVERVARETWNASADTWNSWDNLSDQEQSVIREAVAAGVKDGLESAYHEGFNDACPTMRHSA